MGVATHWIHLGTHTHEREPTPDTAWRVRTQRLRPKIEPTMTGKKVNETFPNDFCYTHRLLHSPIVTRETSNDRSYYRKLMVIDEETHSQTLGRRWIILWKRGRKEYGSQRGQGHHKKTNQLT